MKETDGKTENKAELDKYNHKIDRNMQRRSV